MIEEVARIFRTGDRFLVVTHVNPDGDAVGSLLGTFLAFREMGKRTWALCPEPLSEMYDHLPGRDLIIADASQVEAAPQWIVAVDSAEEERIAGDISAFRNSAGLINIDHHRTNPLFGDLNFVDPHASSSAQLVYEIFKQAGYELSPDVGKCLFTGLVTDTGCFRFSGVNSRTFDLAAELLASGFDSYEVTRPLFEELPLSRLALERLVLERMEILLGGRFCVSSLFADDFKRLGADPAETENLVNRLRELRGVEAGALITELPEGLTRVSLRSKGSLDVSRVAAAFGGGGHRVAAGLRSTLPVNQIKEEITQAVRRVLEENPRDHAGN